MKKRKISLRKKQSASSQRLVINAFDASVDKNNVCDDHCVLWRQLVLVFDILQHVSKREQGGRVFVY